MHKSWSSSKIFHIFQLSKALFKQIFNRISHQKELPQKTITATFHTYPTPIRENFLIGTSILEKNWHKKVRAQVNSSHFLAFKSHFQANFQQNFTSKSTSHTTLTATNFTLSSNFRLYTSKVLSNYR